MLTAASRFDFRSHTSPGQKVFKKHDLCYFLGSPMRGTGESSDREARPEVERFHRFTSTTVHQFREPARMLSVYTEILRSEAGTQLGPEGVRAVEFLHKAALQMQNLLDGLAEFALATDQKRRGDRKVALDLPLRQALLRLRTQIQEAGAKISYTALPEVWADTDRLELIFEHLIGNALRYRKDGIPEIEVSAKSDENTWTIRVSDNGPGVASEFREKIFEPYTRLHGREVPGNGLGLAVCREIVEGLGGKIWLESGPDGGAVFCFALPHHGELL
jgi:signal transduction histidine kinase